MEYFEPGVQLLDIAAGTGAMSLRMQHLGFKVTATDYFPESFKLDSVPFTQADLNDRFSSAFPQRFRAIIASEIIEHLENPWHFARECFKLLEPGGRMLLSTPNIENAGSKASFIRSGAFLWFNEDDYGCYGHICPLTQWQIHQVFREAGFRVRWKGSFGEGASRLDGAPRLSLLARFIALISLMKANLGREVFVAVMEKPLD